MELLYEKLLRGSKNLLAFSAGIDSTALFFLLEERGIAFDIAIVDYALRKQSQQEVAYAKELAQRFQKKIYIKRAPLTPPAIEKRARDIRYRFFEEIIATHHYDTLITAHHLGDQLEWFLMQLSKGAGLVELVGMAPLEQRKGYKLLRPLLEITKDELLEYLHQKNITYFVDESNFDTSYFRNFIRHNFAKPFLEQFKEGVKRSFRYLLEDKATLLGSLAFSHIQELYIAKKPSTPSQTLRLLDRIFKHLGYLLSTSQKRELLRQKEGVIAHTIAFAITKDAIFVAPYHPKKLTKKEKESYRKAKIPKTLRGYISYEGIDPDTIWELYRALQKSSPQSHRLFS